MTTYSTLAGHKVVEFFRLFHFFKLHNEQRVNRRLELFEKYFPASNKYTLESCHNRADGLKSLKYEMARVSKYTRSLIYTLVFSGL